ncbi:MAG: threonine synthase [Vicinamibacterales bacterium]
MICVSTRGQSPQVSFSQAILAGLAPDGGLYVPARIEPQSAEWWQSLKGKSFQDAAVAMAGALIGDEIESAALTAIVSDALNFPVPLRRLDAFLQMVELFHGPTFAFKDVGARFLARLMAHFHGAGEEPLTVLVATSGDTGSAVAQAFFGVPRTRVVVLYPEGQVTAVQEAQFTTLGGNITAIAVTGSFDDCQRLAKEAFADSVLGARLRLTSANSISLGRLLPQMFYYGHAAVQVPKTSQVLFSVPSGNFGNLAAGLMAWRMGAPIDRFVAATTINDTVPRYLATGVLEPRPSVPTLANAMDVGNPSNLERLQWLFGHDLDAMRATIETSVHTDDQVKDGILDLFDRFRVVADPHTAISYLGATRDGIDGTAARPHFFLATAHPAKFREVVEPIIGQDVPLPEALADALARPRIVQRLTNPVLAELSKLL